MIMKQITSKKFELIVPEASLDDAATYKVSQFVNLNLKIKTWDVCWFVSRMSILTFIPVSEKM